MNVKTGICALLMESLFSQNLEKSIQSFTYDNYVYVQESHVKDLILASEKNVVWGFGKSYEYGHARIAKDECRWGDLSQLRASYKAYESASSLEVRICSAAEMQSAQQLLEENTTKLQDRTYLVSKKKVLRQEVRLQWYDQSWDVTFVRQDGPTVPSYNRGKIVGVRHPYMELTTATVKDGMVQEMKLTSRHAYFAFDSIVIPQLHCHIFLEGLKGDSVCQDGIVDAFTENTETTLREVQQFLHRPKL